MELTKSRFELLVQLDPITSAPFRILETMQTSDGCRTRVKDGAMRTAEEALFTLAQLRAEHG